MCKWGTDKEVRVRIPANLSCSRRAKWKKVKIDSCIADIVDALQKGGIETEGSCCGHNSKYPGHINFTNGRGCLIILNEKQMDKLDQAIEGGEKMPWT